MNRVASLFLRAKHWQMFLLLFAVPTVAEMAAAVSISTRTIRSWNDLGRADLLLLGGTMLYILCVVTWFWSMGSFLGSIVKPELKLKEGFFRFALVYSALYMCVFVGLILTPEPGRAAFIVPLHLLCMFCSFYILYFVSKTLVLVETGKSASFYSYAGPFFLLWFYPLGVWLIQPKVNQLYAGRGDAESMERASIA